VEPTTVLGLTGFAMFLTAGLIARLPVGRCQECSHCHEVDRLEAEKQHRQQLSQSVVASRRCPRCGGDHDPDEED
jgi:hypothetical protein